MLVKNKKQLFRHFRHAALMVLRNRRAYIKLSVTVVLSFTILLGYMAFTDATLYNRYAKVLSLPREVVQCYIYDNPMAVHAFQNVIQTNIPNAELYTFYSVVTELSVYDAHLNAECFFLPGNVETLFSVDGSSTVDPNSKGQSAIVEPIQLIGEKKDFGLRAGEVIVNESFYKSISSGNASETYSIPLTLYWSDGSVSIWDLKIIGICKDQHGDFISNQTPDGKIQGEVSLFISQELLQNIEGKSFDSVKYICNVSSDSPEQAMQFGRSIGMVAQGAAEAQEQAKTEMRISLRSKSITAIILFVLLSINLYSSLSNVLETRNFEIGVKRAVGASKWAITKQFLYEAIIVLGFDTILSFSLAIDGIIFYKFIQKYFYGIHWIAHVSTFSIEIYLFCCLGLTIIFGLIFAYKATQVEIVKYLKAE